MEPGPEQPAGFGYGEAVFDAAYLLALWGSAFSLLQGQAGCARLAGAMALLAAGRCLPSAAQDQGHPENTPAYKALGLGARHLHHHDGVVYLLLWHLGTLLFPAVPRG